MLPLPLSPRPPWSRSCCFPHGRAASPQLSLHLPGCHRDVKRGRQARGPLTQKVGAKLEARGPQGEDATGVWPQGCAAPAAEAGSRAPNISGPGGCQDGHRAVDHRALTEQRGGVSAQEADRTGGRGGSRRLEKPPAKSAKPEPQVRPKAMVCTGICPRWRLPPVGKASRAKEKRATQNDKWGLEQQGEARQQRRNAQKEVAAKPRRRPVGQRAGSELRGEG